MDTIKTFAPESIEFARLRAAAILLTAKSPNHYTYYVDETYFDFGQNWRWTTILCKGKACRYQALCPRDHESIVLGHDLEAVTSEILADKFNPDK